MEYCTALRAARNGSGLRAVCESLGLGLGVQRVERGHFEGLQDLTGQQRQGEITGARVHLRARARHLHFDLAEVPVVILRGGNVAQLIMRAHIFHHFVQRLGGVVGIGDQEAAGGFRQLRHGCLRIGVQAHVHRLVLLEHVDCRVAGRRSCFWFWLIRPRYATSRCWRLPGDFTDRPVTSTQ